MLPKSERLKDKRLFNIAFNVGKKQKQRISSELLSLYYLFKRKDINKSAQNKSPIKTAFIVGLRVEKRATKRNLVKRRMRAAYRLIMKSVINKDKNKMFSVLIWIANPKIKDATFEQIKGSMQKLFERLNNTERRNG